MGKPSFPATETFDAPPSWRCIDFISDLHLHEELPHTTAALEQYLATSPADAIFILGDLFEAWVGDDMRHQPYEHRCVEMLKAAGQRCHLGIMVGNRDFLLGADMLADCHAHSLIDPFVIEAWGERALLMHGDELCLADTRYLQFRAQVRQATWQEAFLGAPLEARLAQAKQMRAASQAHQKAQPQQEWADVNEGAAADWMRAANTSILVHGHTHQPQSAPFAGGTRHVLSDWDLDHGHPRAEVLRWTPAGFARIALT